ncbi:MAG TPA: hypothetical protein DD791_04985 [Syntrophomonas sp.]|nr:hypothetical protein [Syntrophomonas sp.]
MRNFRQVLGGIVFAILFFLTPLVNILLWVLLLIIGSIYFISIHLREQEANSGSWVMHWDIFLQHMLVGFLILLPFTLYLFRDLTILPLIMVGLFLMVTLYAGLMGLKKENTSNCST